jgi:hypothetical protein
MITNLGNYILDELSSKHDDDRRLHLLCCEATMLSEHNNSERNSRQRERNAANFLVMRISIATTTTAEAKHPVKSSAGSTKFDLRKKQLSPVY